MAWSETGGTTPPPPTPITYLSQPMDNDAHQLFVNGGYSFSPTTRGTVKLAYTIARQDEHLPTKDVAGLSLASSPQSLDGRVDTLLVQAGVTSRPLKDLSVNANVRYHDLKDKTPVARFVQTNPACGAGQCVDNTPFSISTKSGKLEGTYRLPFGYSINGGIDLRQQERSIPVANSNGAGGSDTQRVVPLRSDLDEVTYRIEGRKAMSETINGAAAVLFSQRDGSAYISAGAGAGGTFSDLINPIHLADRDRTKFRLSADWAILDTLSVQVVAEGSKDEYKTSTARPHGLFDGYGKLVSLDVNYAMSDKWQASAWASYDQSKATQFNRNDANSALVRTKLVDTGNTAGLGIAGSPLGKVRVGGNVEWARNTSRYPQDLFDLATNAAIANPAPLADVENKAVTLKAFAEYALDKSSALRFDVTHERWQTNDWSWAMRDGSPFVYTGCNFSPSSGCTAATLATRATDGTVAVANQKQLSNYAGIRYNLRFQ
jgi:MtrB/PioB family decaheme-associated outer membrane protein